MGELIGNVLLDPIELGWAHTERSVALLPCKRGRRFPHPSAGVCLQGPHGIGQRRFCGQNNENVDVVCSAAHGQHVHRVVARDSGEVVPQIGLTVGRDEMRALFGAEDDVEEGTDVAVRHIVSPLKGLRV